jgi:hypothetical protein
VGQQLGGFTQGPADDRTRVIHERMQQRLGPNYMQVLQQLSEIFQEFDY